jgi:DnaK suppressor protein
MKNQPKASIDHQISKYRQILLSQKESALAGLGAKARVLTNADRIGEEDQAQSSLAEAVSLRLNGLEYSQLRQIQEALDRLQLGEYGICLSCDESIPGKRLEALPWARYCVKCQEAIVDETDDFRQPDED